MILAFYQCKTEQEPRIASDDVTKDRDVSNDDLKGYQKEKVYEPIQQVDTITNTITEKKSEEIEKETPAKAVAEPIKKVKKSKRPAKKPKPPVKKMPVIEFESLHYDFGEINQGDIVEIQIPFKNTGNAPLQILEADASCGCTTPTVPFLDILPGASNKIGIKFNSLNKTGEQKPTLIIKSNTEPAYHVFNMHGYVHPKEEKVDSTQTKTENPDKE